MVSSASSSNTLIRETNLAAVLRYLHKDAPLSRAQLSVLTGLNKSTISSLVDELIRLELIFEMGIDPSKNGRPATLLNLNPKAGWVIGIDMGVGFISIVLTNFVGEVVWRRSVEQPSFTNQEICLSTALQLTDEACDYARAQEARLLGIGVSLPGMVDAENGVLVFSPNLQWRDVPIRQLFSRRTGLPVFADNDANAAALGEHIFGVARRVQNFIFIIAAVGVGGGLFLNGDLYRGPGGLAGEIGHTSIYADQARPCRCGNWGCWENYANQTALIDRVRARLEVGRSSIISKILEEQNNQLTLDVITQAAEAGDTEALEAIRENGAALGLGIANLINIFNPEMVVIGGALSQAGRFLLPSVQEVVDKRAVRVMRKQTEIRLSAFGPDASMMGAAALVVLDVLSKPARSEDVQVAYL